jgi:SAM-dependent methyltransferase
MRSSSRPSSLIRWCDVAGQINSSVEEAQVLPYKSSISDCTFSAYASIMSYKEPVITENPLEIGRSSGRNYRVSQQYWEQIHAPQFLGVTALGQGGLSEVLYRQYEEVRHLKKIVAFDRHKSVLELGSGNGRWAFSLAPLVAAYVGIDFSQSMIDAASRQTAELGLSNVTFHRVALQNYTPDQRFDVIHLSSVSQYLHDEDLKALLARLQGALKPKGIVVDRSTTRDRARLVLETGDYFAVYRTGAEIVALYREAGWTNYYRRPSYRVLTFPHVMRGRVAGRKFARLVSVTAPFSFYLLRAWAAGTGTRFDRTSQLAEFSHDFFLFRRSSKDGLGGEIATGGAG